MFSKIFTALALALTFATSKPPHNTEVKFAAGVNGTFFDRKTGYLAGFLVVDGKKLGEFPIHSTKVRGGIVCLVSGNVLSGYFKVIEGKLYFSKSPMNYNHIPENMRGIRVDEKFLKQIRWAITGGGLFLLDGEVVKNVGKKESLSNYIINHTKYSFILVHKDRRTITVGVSYKVKPYDLAAQLRGKYSAFLRLDGGSSVTVFRGKKPSFVNNAVGLAEKR